MVSAFVVVAVSCLLMIGVLVALAMRRRNAQSQTGDDAPSPGELRREKYASLLRGLFSRTFGNADGKEMQDKEEIWKEWLNVGYMRKNPDPYAILGGDMGDEFRARAIAVLIAPDLAFLPFAWKDQGFRCYLPPCIAFEGLSPKLRDFTVELILLNVDFVLTAHADELYHSLFHYNDYILEALTVLPETDPMALALFDRYRICDPGHHLPGVSWYHCITAIFRSGVPEHWKRLADEKMRTVIIAERSGMIARGESETALDRYLTCINGFLKAPVYSDELFASQVEFALDLPNVAHHRLFETWNLQRLFRSLPGDDKKELRHRIARHMVLGSHYCGEEKIPHFEIRDEAGHAAALEMLAEWSGEDPELRDRITKLLAKRESGSAIRAALGSIH